MGVWTPAQGFLYKHNDVYYGSCSMEHLERIKERIEKGEKLARKSYTNKDGIAYARKRKQGEILRDCETVVALSYTMV